MSTVCRLQYGVRYTMYELGTEPLQRIAKTRLTKKRAPESVYEGMPEVFICILHTPCLPLVVVPWDSYVWYRLFHLLAGDYVSGLSLSC